MRLAIIIICLLLRHTAAADTLLRPYNPLAQPRQQLTAAVQQAKTEGKRILIQVGGNWCVQCYRMESLMKADTAIKETLRRSYVVVRIAYNKQQPDLSFWSRLRSPQRFGFPSFVVLDAQGKYLHTQPGTTLQKGNGYHSQKVLQFLESWAAVSEQKMF